jgi:hypothetical protein
VNDTGGRNAPCDFDGDEGSERRIGFFHVLPSVAMRPVCIPKMMLKISYRSWSDSPLRASLLPIVWFGFERKKCIGWPWRYLSIAEIELKCKPLLCFREVVAKKENPPFLPLLTILNHLNPIDVAYEGLAIERVLF